MPILFYKRSFELKNFLRTCTVKIYREQSFVWPVSAHELFASDTTAGPRDHNATLPSNFALH